MRRNWADVVLESCTIFVLVMALSYLGRSKFRDLVLDLGWLSSHGPTKAFAEWYIATPGHAAISCLVIAVAISSLYILSQLMIFKAKS
ncbi:hypothetical protein Tter_0702 [Thermobaculum terrenum ATCC BAA-798]|uniref:Uncharacterized protein n=1 Tax=Thermobaculum terrenum (strain ATCC BAA-798 / CCMEE 7001 / YNP1) TaxID=525904 RepID=D1CFB3_THET1|nr:hypothetical protein Tter_0702 [Thermobaculum terrenum ATCC BAA-798]